MANENIEYTLPDGYEQAGSLYFIYYNASLARYELFVYDSESDFVDKGTGKYSVTYNRMYASNNLVNWSLIASGTREFNFTVSVNCFVVFSDYEIYNTSGEKIYSPILPSPKYLIHSITKNEWYSFDGTTYNVVPVTEPTIESMNTYGLDITPTYTDSLQEFGDFKIYAYEENQYVTPTVITTGRMQVPIHTKDIKVEHQIVSVTIGGEELKDIEIDKDGYNYYFDTATSTWIQDDKIRTSHDVVNDITQEQWALLGPGVYNIHPVLLDCYSCFKSITINYF